MICVKWLKKKKTGGKCLSENEQQENDRMGPLFPGDIDVQLPKFP